MTRHQQHCDGSRQVTVTASGCVQRVGPKLEKDFIRISIVVFETLFCYFAKRKKRMLFLSKRTKNFKAASALFSMHFKIFDRQNLRELL